MLLVSPRIDTRTCFQEMHPTIEDIYIANVETDRGSKEKLRFYDTAGLEPSQHAYGNAQQLSRHYLAFADGYVLVYDPSRAESLNVLMSLKSDIDKSKDKKEVVAIVVANNVAAAHGHEEGSPPAPPAPPSDPTELGRTVHKCEVWCKQNKLRCFDVDISDRASLFEGFVHLSSRLCPPPNKSTFSQLSMSRKSLKADNN